MVLGDGVDDGVAENIPCAQGWSWSRAGARAAADPEIEGISCTQEWFGWMAISIARMAYSLCAGMVFWLWHTGPNPEGRGPVLSAFQRGRGRSAGDKTLVISPSGSVESLPSFG